MPYLSKSSRGEEIESNTQRSSIFAKQFQKLQLKKHEDSDCHKEALQCMVVPPKTTRGIGEQTFSAMRQVKSYMRATMTLEWLNHLMILHVHKPLTESLDLVEIANSFVNSEHRLTVFGKFNLI